MRHALKPLKTSALLLLSLSATVLFDAARTPGLAEEAKTHYRQPIEKPILPDILSGPDETYKTTGKSGKSPDLAYGAYQRGFYLTALGLALTKAEQGDLAAQTLIAELYWNGQGVERDAKKATEWYQLAAEAGGREAQFAIANILLLEKSSTADKRLGEQYMRKAAEAGHPRAQYNVAQIRTARRPTWSSFKKALPYYQSAANARIAEAQYAMAIIHSEARGVLINDDAKARSWLMKSARNGYAKAQFELGVWLANGRGGKTDSAAALLWITRAASQGNVVAQNRLARIYAFSDDDKKNLIKAGTWHIVSQRSGYKDSELDRVIRSLPEVDINSAVEAANRVSRSIVPQPQR
jgi:TPR repeat protein